jgi:hypothetical protein
MDETEDRDEWVGRERVVVWEDDGRPPFGETSEEEEDRDEEGLEEGICRGDGLMEGLVPFVRGFENGSETVKGEVS